MNDFSSLIVHYGYVVICLIVFAEAIGVPVPGAVALVAGGAAAAAGTCMGRRSRCLRSLRCCRPTHSFTSSAAIWDGRS
jgi:hypothetical protein